MSLQNTILFLNETWRNNANLSNYPLYAYEAPADVCHLICTYSNIILNQWNTTTYDGDNYSAQINIFATEEQFRQGLILRDQIKEAFRRVKSIVYGVKMCDSYNGSIIKDIDNKGWHIIINLELMVQN